MLYENGAIEPNDSSATYQWGTVSTDNYPAELVDLSGFTPEQAYRQGEKLIEDLELNEAVGLGNMYLNIVFSNPKEAAQVNALANKNQLTKQETLNFDEIYKETLQSCVLNAQDDVYIYYTLNYCRNIRGVLVTHDVPSTFVSDEAWGPQWVHEDIALSVMPEGIGSFSWSSPYEVTEVRAENSTMLPFSDVSAIFKKMILYENEQLFDSADIDSGLSQLEFVVTKVTLSLQRIIEKNNIDNGLLVPIWNFYGVQVGRSKDGLEVAFTKDTPWLSYRHFRHSFGAAPFLRSGHIVGLPLGAAPLSRLPQRPYHERPVLRGHGAHFTDPLRTAVYRFLHWRRKERLHQGIPAAHHGYEIHRREGCGLRRFRRAGAGIGDIHCIRLCCAAVPAHGGLPQSGRECAELLWQSNGDGAHVFRLRRVLVADGVDLRRPHQQQIYGLRLALCAVLCAHHPV